MGANFPVAVIIRAVDRVTEPLRKITASIERAKRPFNELGGAWDRFTRASGLPRVQAAFSRASMAVGDLGRRVTWAAIKFGGIVTAAGVAGYAIVRSSSEAAERLQNLAEKLGVNVERLQEWRYGARLANVTAEDLEQGMFNLARQLAAAQRGDRGAVGLFARLGFSREDLRDVRDVGELLPVLADRLNRTRNAQTRAADASQLFGRQGRALLPFLAQGAQGMAALADEAHRLGLVMSPDEVARMSKLANGFARLDLQIEGIRNRIGVALGPAATKILERFAGWLERNQQRIEAWADALGEDLPRAIDRAVGWIERAVVMGRPFLKLLEMVNNVLGPIGTGIAIVAGALTLSLVPAVLSTISALVTLSGALVATPAGWVILVLTAIAALLLGVAAAIGYVALRWDFFKEKFPMGTALIEKLLKHWVVQTASQLYAVAVVFEWFAGLVIGMPDRIAAAWEGLGEFFTGLFDWIETRFSRVVAFIADKVETVNGLVPDWVKDLLLRSMSPLAFAANAALGGGAESARDAATRAATPPVRVQSESRVRVDFNNVPRGTRVTPESGGDVDLDVALGWANFGI